MKLKLKNVVTAFSFEYFSEIDKLLAVNIEQNIALSSKPNH